MTLLHTLPPLSALPPQPDRQVSSKGCDHQARRLVLRLTKSLHASGVAAPELEDTVRSLGDALGLKAVSLASPTSLFLSFQGAGAPELHLERVDPGDVHLGRLVQLEDLKRSIEAGTLSVEEALARLDGLENDGQAYGPALTCGAYALVSAAAAILFQAGLGDAVAAGLIGFGIGLLHSFVLRGGLARLVEPLSAALSTIAAIALAKIGLVVDADAVALAAVIVLIPGYTLTVAMSELAQRHLTSGTTRFFGAFGTFLGLGLGVSIGRLTGESLFGPVSSGALVPPDSWALIFALCTTPLAFGILFGVAPRHFGLVALGGLIAYGGARLGTAWIGPELGAGLGALLIGTASNAYARKTHRPSALPLVPGILLLVPGSIGFRSIAQFLQHDPLSGIEAAFRMAFAATTLVAGLLTAHALFPPTRPQPTRSPSPPSPRSPTETGPFGCCTALSSTAQRGT